jgi:dihydrofolate synthase/folylpolyglutamate synthase
MDANILAQKCRQAGLRGETLVGVKAALQAAKNIAGNNDVIFVGGSTFVVAEIILK